MVSLKDLKVDDLFMHKGEVWRKVSTPSFNALLIERHIYEYIRPDIQVEPVKWKLSYSDGTYNISQTHGRVEIDEPPSEIIEHLRGARLYYLWCKWQDNKAHGRDEGEQEYKNELANYRLDS